MTDRHQTNSVQASLLMRQCLLCILAVGLASLGACAVGPDFVRPAPPSARSYTATAQPVTISSRTGAGAQYLQPARSIPGQWWELFRSSKLEAVVAEAVRNSKTVAAARAALAEAKQNVIAARGGLLPQADLSGSAERSGSSGAQRNAIGENGVGSLYSVGPRVGYALDLFGGARRALEQQQALAEYQRYELGAAYLSLTGNVVTQSVAIASLGAQIQATEEVVATDERNLALVKRKDQAGKAARIDVLAAQAQLQSDLATLPPLRQQLAAARHALSALTGRSPADWSPPDFRLSDFRLPEHVPVTLPSRLVRQRPDILAAEAQLHSSSAAIGVAAANLYPSITLSGTLSRQALDADTLFGGANTVWNLGANLTTPLFHGGTLTATRQAAVEAYRNSLAAYEQTVVEGLQQVADTLQALVHDAQLLDAESDVLATARESQEMQRISYDAGKSDLIQLLDAQRTYLQARLGYVRAQALRLQDTAALFVALGGGWESAPFAGEAP